MHTNAPQFIDVFAGAGGLSLGLLKAGWKGLFAVEKSPMAFETLKHNLIDQKDGLQFQWPDWLPKEAIDIQTLLERYKDLLVEFKGISLLAGGPPCQGFSNSGRRRINDQRNRLFEQYLEFVKILQPKMLLIENVRGFAKSFTKTEKGAKGQDISEKPFNADEELSNSLTALGYQVYREYGLMAKEFGVPQLRPRYILIAIHGGFLYSDQSFSPFNILREIVREPFLENYGLSSTNEITLKEAISDLEKRHGGEPCIEPRMSSFFQGHYGPIKSAYQKLMRQDRDGDTILRGKLADSHRFTNHKPEISARFQRIINECPPGLQLNDAKRAELGLLKHRIAPLAAKEACHTLTSLPDDCIHYNEPRILTVREYARIQSFPDWFVFKAKYTTGDKNRQFEVPRYTQVANAVPPLLAEAFGLTLSKILETSPTTKIEETEPFNKLENNSELLYLQRNKALKQEELPII